MFSNNVTKPSNQTATSEVVSFGALRTAKRMARRSVGRIVGLVAVLALTGLSVVVLAPDPALTQTSESVERVVNVYSYRQPFLVQPLFDRFTEQTGIAVNVVFARHGLVERLRIEGSGTPADLLLTSDMSDLLFAVSQGLTRSVSSPVLEGVIPATDRDPDGHWFGLTRRARVIFASRERVPEGVVTSYADLADARWRRRVCTRSGTHPYQISLVAARIVHEGRLGARRWLEGVRDNLARRPQGNDRAQIRAVAEGVCDLALANSYYFAVMASDPEQRRWTDQVYMIFPDQDGDGTHINLSGIAMTRHSQNSQAALDLMHFLVRDDSQRFFTQSNHEYPVRRDVPWPELLGQRFESDDLLWSQIFAQRSAALRLTYEIGYDR